MTRTLEVMPRMKKRYSFKEDYPSEFKYRCKCLILFQNLDGVDVILFGLYVYEHDETNAPPNQRAVYVSYLDSIYYMRPRNMRTFVYHELLTSYLDYVRCKGYSTAHIWACPPLKGDDYILFAKPEDQKTPKDDRLRQWYVDMLQECQRRGIVGKMTNAYDLYFSNEKNDATILPYMEGDYFPGELENIIKDIDEGKNLSKKPDKAGKSSKDGTKKKKAKKGNREGTRSGGLDQELLAASGIQPEGVDVRSIQEGGKDYVMSRLGETIYRMKDNFIVAYLNWEGQSEENMVVPKEIMEYRKKHGIKAIKPCSGSDEVKVKVDEGEEEEVPVKEVSADAAKEGADTKMTEPEGGENKKESSDDEKGIVKVKAESEETPSKPEGGDEVEKVTADEGAEEAKPEEATKEGDEPEGDEADKAEEKREEKDGEAPSEEEKEAKPEAENFEGDGSEEKPDAVMSEGEGGKEEESKDEQKPEGDASMKEENPEQEENKDEKKSEGEEVGDENKSTGEEGKHEKPEGESAKLDGDEEQEDEHEGESRTEDAAADQTEDKKDCDAKDVEMDDAAQSQGAKSPAREGKFAAMEKRKKDLEGDEAPRPDEATSKPDEIPSKSMTKDSKGRLVKIIDDDDEEMDCEFLNNRQLFLNLCQGNHYQFDSLRRAKHTSMMVLWHLHNRDAPKFVQQCALCAREILQGKRYHYLTCADFDFDQCQCYDYECLRNPNTPRHPHPLQPIPVGSQQSALTPEQRAERQRSIQLHMTLLLHASTCRSQPCSSANCAKMKGLLKMERSARSKPQVDASVQRYLGTSPNARKAV